MDGSRVHGAAVAGHTQQCSTPLGNSPRGGAPKRYLAATPEALAEAYATMAAVKRNVYEVITPEWPCVLYFDLEFARDEHGEQRAVSMEGEH